MKKFRVWYGDGNDRTTIAQVEADSIDDVIKFCRENMLDPDEWTEEGDEQCLFLIEDDPCEHCPDRIMMYGDYDQPLGDYCKANEEFIEDLGEVCSSAYFEIDLIKEFVSWEVDPITLGGEDVSV